MTLDMRNTFIILRYNFMSVRCVGSSKHSHLEYHYQVGSELWMSALWTCSECSSVLQISQPGYSLHVPNVRGNNQIHLQCLLWDLGKTHTQCLDSQTCFPWDVSCSQQPLSQMVASPIATTACISTWTHSSHTLLSGTCSQCAGVSTKSPDSEWSDFIYSLFSCLFVYIL